MLEQESQSFITNDFRRSCEEICQILSDYGHQVRPYQDPNLAIFGRLDCARQNQALSDIRIYLSSIYDTRGLKKNPNLGMQFLWSSLKTYGLKCPHDFFNKISEDCIIELYDLEYKQVWRNFHFFDVCSYTIEQVFCEPWTDRYKRDEKMMQKCIELTKACLEGSFETMTTNLPAHLISERYSEFGYDIMITHSHLAPVRLSKTAKLAGYLVLSSGKVISQQTNKYEPTMTRAETIL